MEEYSNNIAQELSLLHTLSGADFSRKVEQIARRSEFHPVENEKDILLVKRMMIGDKDFVKKFIQKYNR